MLGKIRSNTKSALIKIAKVLSILPLSANQFTFTAVILSGVAAYFLANEKYIFGVLFVVLASLIDLLDGSFAYVKNQKSPFGNYFDAIIDKVVEVIIYFGLAFNYPILAFICLATTMLVSYAKPRVALVIETDNHDWPAIGERGDRLCLLVLGLIIAEFVHIDCIYTYNFDIVQISLCIIAVVTFIGFIQRIFYAKKLIKKAQEEGKLLSYLKLK